MSFSQDAWERNFKLYKSILNLPFNQDLASGHLTKCAFAHYLIQDAHFLLAYARALSICSAKAYDAHEVMQFAQSAQTAIVTERGLHREFMSFLNISEESFKNTPLSLTTHHYTSFLNATAWSESYPVVLASLLPCFWIYAQVGRDLADKSNPSNPYQAWIDTYASEEYHSALRKLLKTIDRVAEKCDEDTIARMHHAYTMATKLEWLFWESAYKQSHWHPKLDMLEQPIRTPEDEKSYYFYHI